MKLDYDLIRQLLVKIEQETPQDTFYTENEQECYHLKQMISGGLVEGWSHPDEVGGWSSEITDLTMRGHEFLAACRKKKVWEAMKKACEEKGVSVGIDLIVSLTKKVTFKLMEMACEVAD